MDSTIKAASDLSAAGAVIAIVIIFVKFLQWLMLQVVTPLVESIEKNTEATAAMHDFLGTRNSALDVVQAQILKVLKGMEKQNVVFHANQKVMMKGIEKNDKNNGRS